MNPSLTVQIARASTGVVLGCLGFAVVPVFGMPFSGCVSVEWLVLPAACSHWPEALRGFLFVLPIAVLTPTRWRLPVVANILLLAIALAGGASAVKAGDHLYSSITIARSFELGYPILVGGLVAFCLELLYERSR